MCVVCALEGNATSEEASLWDHEYCHISFQAEAPNARMSRRGPRENNHPWHNQSSSDQMFLKYQELVHKMNSKDVETQQQSNFALDLYGMYNQIQGNDMRNEHWRLRNNLRESEIDQLEKMVHSKAVRREELEKKLYTDRTENLNARLGLAEQAIAEGAKQGKQHAHLMSKK